MERSERESLNVRMRHGDDDETKHKLEPQCDQSCMQGTVQQTRTTEKRHHRQTRSGHSRAFSCCSRECSHASCLRPRLQMLLCLSLCFRITDSIVFNVPTYSFYTCMWNSCNYSHFENGSFEVLSLHCSERFLDRTKPTQFEVEQNSVTLTCTILVESGLKAFYSMTTMHDFILRQNLGHRHSAKSRWPSKRVLVTASYASVAREILVLNLSSSWESFVFVHTLLFDTDSFPKMWLRVERELQGWRKHRIKHIEIKKIVSPVIDRDVKRLWIDLAVETSLIQCIVIWGSAVGRQFSVLKLISHLWNSIDSRIFPTSRPVKELLYDPKIDFFGSEMVESAYSIIPISSLHALSDIRSTHLEMKMPKFFWIVAECRGFVLLEQMVVQKSFP